MKEFIEHIHKSIYAPDYYRDLLNRPASYSWKYYGSLAMLLALCLTIATSLPLLPRLHDFLHAFPQAVAAAYPQDLEVDIKDGKVSTNVAEPYFLDVPAGGGVVATSTLPSSSASTTGSTTPTATVLQNLASSTAPVRILTIDTKSDVTRERFASYDTLFWLTRDSLISLDTSGGMREMKLADIDFTMNQSTLKGITSEIEPYFVFIPPVLVLVIFVGMLLSFAAMLGYLVIDALFVFFLGRFLGEKWSYAQSYHIALHAVTLPLILTSIFFILPIGNLQIPFFTAGLLLVVVFFNFRKKGNLSTAFDKEG